jgi:hypothetical protein
MIEIVKRCYYHIIQYICCIPIPNTNFSISPIATPPCKSPAVHLNKYLPSLEEDEDYQIV